MKSVYVCECIHASRYTLRANVLNIVNSGDVIVQRGTNHAWSNPSKTGFARVFYIGLDATAPTVNGRELEASLGQVTH